MENNTVEEKVNKKSGKLWILKSVILIATVLALAAILITIIILFYFIFKRVLINCFKTSMHFIKLIHLMRSDSA